MTVRLADASTVVVCNAIVDLVDGGAGAGRLLIREGVTVRATITLNDPSFGAAAVVGANAEAALDVSPTIEDTNVDATTVGVDAYTFEDSNFDDMWTGTVGTSGADIIFDSVVFCAGGTATITAGTVTVPRS